MGTPGPVGFEPGMFKKELDEHKSKTDSSNKVCKDLAFFFYYKEYVCVKLFVKFNML